MAGKKRKERVLAMPKRGILVDTVLNEKDPRAAFSALFPVPYSITCRERHGKKERDLR